MNLAQQIMFCRNWYANGIPNGNISNGTTGWSVYAGTLGASGGVLSLTGNGTSTYPNAYQTVTAVIGRKYYMRAFVRMETQASPLKFVIRSESAEIASTVISSPSYNVWHLLSVVKTCGNTSMTFAPTMVWDTSALANGKVMNYKECQVIDLTAIFGANNEPTKEWCDINISPFVKY